ncbi:hypothetical protein R3P38DRAFT_3214574 [Favolaschia claudopus]|uniref:Uncharacterized protein n=1 Tax=Favolaschia claudopus TaxID=2862362 RepID=A0AAW0A9Z4_9AGAR
MVFFPFSTATYPPLPSPPPATMQLLTAHHSELDAFAIAVNTHAAESYCRVDRSQQPAIPPLHSKPVLLRDPPPPERISIHHSSVQRFLNSLRVLSSYNSLYIPESTEIAFTLVAICVLQDETHGLHTLFWMPSRRVGSANTVQRVINSHSRNLELPAAWESAERALQILADQDRRAACKSIAARADPEALTRVSPQKTQMHPPRLTRAAALRSQQNATPNSPAASAPATPPIDSKRRRNPVADASTPAPQRVSARQRMKRAEIELESATIPPAVMASISTSRPTANRTRSSSQESNETLVASTSSSSISPASSRAASVSSAETTVVLDIVNEKGKGRLIAPPTDTVVVEPTVSETGMVTRSRTRKTPPETTESPRATPYPATKDTQVAAGRGTNKRAPTGKRKVAKTK